MKKGSRINEKIGIKRGLLTYTNENQPLSFLYSIKNKNKKYMLQYQSKVSL